MLHWTGWPTPPTACLPHLTASRLEVMREPTVGAFGVGAVVVILVGRFRRLCHPAPGPCWWAHCGAFSRTAMAQWWTGALRPERQRTGQRVHGCAVPLLAVAAAVVATAALGPRGRCRPGRWQWRRVWWASGPSWPGPAGASEAYRDVLGAAGIGGGDIGLLVAAARW